MQSIANMTSFKTLTVALVVLGLLNLTTGLAHPDPNGSKTRMASETLSRRGILSLGLSSLFVLGASDDALAFDNKISNKYDDRPKQTGGKPRDLGVALRKDLIGEEDNVGFKHCKGSPNCFSSTDSAEDDPDHSIPAWIWPKEFGNDKQKAFAELAEVIDAYKPGQDNVDGGGFKIVTNDPKKGYIYTQFQSLKNGYIDDMEVAYIDGDSFGERAVQVRSSSRLGYLDYGVNAKRLNYIAKDLRAKGWDAKGVDFETHRSYAIQNEVN